VVTVVDSEALYEVVAGRHVELPPMGARETHLASELTICLGGFVKPRAMGRVEAEMLFLLDEEAGLERRPDVAFISFERWPRDRPVPTTVAWRVSPNLVVEVVSAANKAPEVVRKVRDYFRTGTDRVWVVYPDEEQVYVYSSPTSIRVVDLAGELDGETVVPGFRLPLLDLFADAQASPPPTSGATSP
jgi:Uma2 family endonuclease